VDIRHPRPNDGQALYAFFQRIPEGDRTFFKEDVLDDQVVTSWVGEDDSHRWLAVEDGQVIGYLAVHPGHGWSNHVGEVRLVVDPSRRRQGLGGQLARRGLVEALNLRLTKVIVEVVSDQEATITLFTGLGFEPEALLRDHIRDRSGRFRDLIVLSHSVPDMSSAMSTLGIDEELQ
jgi:RimJ/RimL family protein N-acetyltransferase